MPTKKNLKNHNGKDKLKILFQDSGEIWVKLSIGLKVDGRTSNIEEKINREGSIASRPRDLKRELKDWDKEGKAEKAAKSGKIKRYKTPVTHYRQKKLIHCKKKGLWEKLGGKSRKNSDPPQAVDARKFWSGIWVNLFNLRKMLNDWLRSRRI